MITLNLRNQNGMWTETTNCWVDECKQMKYVPHFRQLRGVLIACSSLLSTSSRRAMISPQWETCATERDGQQAREQDTQRGTTKTVWFPTWQDELSYDHGQACATTSGETHLYHNPRWSLARTRLLLNEIRKKDPKTFVRIERNSFRGYTGLLGRYHRIDMEEGGGKLLIVLLSLRGHHHHHHIQSSALGFPKRVYSYYYSINT